MMERTTERGAALVDELRNVVVQAEALLEALSADKDDALRELRQRVSTSIDVAKARLADLEQQAGEMAQRASVAAEAYTRENPWTVVGGATALGLILGSVFASTLRADDDYVDDEE
jgi:ElaB/YqjD/DUF883 family membrane-anchored ribosome-binding protein